MRLNKKIALITGAARGIGEAIAHMFTKEGARVIITDIDDESGIKLSKRIQNSKYFHLDVSCESDWKKVFSELKKEGITLDILVNNAGITGFGEGYGPADPENSSLDDWNYIHRVNSDGVFLGCKYGIKEMKSRGGSIINISSRSGLVGIPGACAYASSKASVRNHTKSVALYCADNDYNIRCNSIHPAAILTPMWDPMLGEGDKREEMIEMIANQCPLKQFGKVEDVAFAAVYLSSNEASYITGIELNIDGGILAGAAGSPKKRE